MENTLPFITFYLFDALLTLNVISMLTVFYLRSH